MQTNKDFLAFLTVKVAKFESGNWTFKIKHLYTYFFSTKNNQPDIV